MSNPALLVLNAGSSTLKYAVFSGHAEQRRATRRGTLKHDGSRSSFAAHLGDLLEQLSDLDIHAVGHRIVHGGLHYADPVLLDDTHIEALRRLIPLAPLHQPHNLAGIDAIRQLRPGLPQVACFDTAFHRSQPELAQRYGLPRALHDAGIRRYGFHGLSYAYIASQLPQHLGALAEGRVIVAHLGNGASLCALRERRSVATSMGFSTLDGLLMGTRCGSIDPGVLLYLLQDHNLNPEALGHLLYEESGLLGVSGLSSDMRTLQAADTPEAAEAIALFCHRVVREVGSLAAALGGLDALVFTGGIGEHAPGIRDRICTDLDWLLQGPHGRAPVLTLPTDEEGLIAAETAKKIGVD